MTESVLVSQLQNGLVLEFERSSSDPAQRIRLLLSELLFISSEVSHTLIDFIFLFQDLHIQLLHISRTMYSGTSYFSYYVVYFVFAKQNAFCRLLQGFVSDQSVKKAMATY